MHHHRLTQHDDCSCKSPKLQPVELEMSSALKSRPDAEGTFQSYND